MARNRVTVAQGRHVAAGDEPGSLNLLPIVGRFVAVGEIQVEGATFAFEEDVRLAVKRDEPRT